MNTTEDLIRELRRFAQKVRSVRASLMRDAADALEEITRERDEARNRATAYGDEIDLANARWDRVEQERDALAAVIEALDDKSERLINSRDEEWVEIDAVLWDRYLSNPADALREVKSQVWDECIEAVQEASNNAAADHLPPEGRALYVHNPYLEASE